MAGSPIMVRTAGTTASPSHYVPSGEECIMAGTSERDRTGGSGGLVTPTRVVAVIIVILLIAFVVDNTDKVRVGFVFLHADVALIWVLIITALLGLAVGVLLGRRTRKPGRTGD
jgi:uncharacterized integral membrane protein